MNLRYAGSGQELVLAGFVRDEGLGQTYAVVRREVDGAIVRRWIAPDAPVVYSIRWAEVNTAYIFPGQEILAIPLDDQYPAPNMLMRRFDGGEFRILAHDAELGQWRHVPDLGAFQSRGYYWCNVTAADAGFVVRITLGPPYPASDVPAGRTTQCVRRRPAVRDAEDTSSGRQSDTLPAPSQPRYAAPNPGTGPDLAWSLSHGAGGWVAGSGAAPLAVSSSLAPRAGLEPAT